MIESATFIEITGTILFAIAILHTFLTNFFQKKAHQHPIGTWQHNVFHLLGEVEIVFGLWAGVLILWIIAKHGWTTGVDFVDSLNFQEPIFIFLIMTVAATKPIIQSSQKFILRLASFSHRRQFAVTYFLCLFLGPLLGSFITEPAAMTVTALILYNQFYSRSVSQRFQYVTIAVLFVNISIGGVLTNYAAPPVLMVADTWSWSTSFMFLHFGWKALMATTINAMLATYMLFTELCELEINEPTHKTENDIPTWLIFAHFAFLVLIVLTSHHTTFCIGIFLFFLGLTIITPNYQEELKLRQSLLVAFFLAGLVVLGAFQGWWLSPLLTSLSEFPLFLGSTILTSVTDNATLTYLGSQVHDITDVLKYALVAGAVAGGGLTVVANAPNPAGFSILQRSFGPDGIHPGKLFLYGIVPTLIAMGCFWLL